MSPLVQVGVHQRSYAAVGLHDHARPGRAADRYARVYPVCEYAPSTVRSALCLPRGAAAGNADCR